MELDDAGLEERLSVDSIVSIYSRHGAGRQNGARSVRNGQQSLGAAGCSRRPGSNDPGHSLPPDFSCSSMAFSRMPTINALSEALSSLAQLANCSCKTGGMRIWKWTTVSGMETSPWFRRTRRRKLAVGYQSPMRPDSAQADRGMHWYSTRKWASAFINFLEILSFDRTS
jgi:hypothetical protein